MRQPRSIKLTEADKIRFWEKVDRCGSNECWEWQACRHPEGYGQFRIGDFVHYANRVAFVITNGDTKLHVLHTCDNPSCCNPEHLYAGTPKDNSKQRDERGRQGYGDNRGEKHGLAKLTESDVREIRGLYTDGWSQRAIAKDYGISQSQVSSICSREGWRHI